MIPRLGEKYKGLVEIETISKPRQEFRDIEYKKLGLPMAPAVMVGKEHSSYRDVSLPRRRFRPPSAVS